MLAWGKYLVLIPALGPLVYYCLAAYAGWSYRKWRERQPAPGREYAPPVSILKPVRGVDNGARANFQSFCGLDYPEYEVIFAVADPYDPVVPILQEIQSQNPETTIRVVTGIEQTGSSRKANSLIRLGKEAKHELLAISDSDVRVEKDYLRDVVAPFADPQVGCVTSFFRGVTGSGWVADMDALGVPTESAGKTLVAWRFGEIDFAFGWTMATTKTRLAEIGGFEAMANFHADDFLLGNKIAEKGYRVELTRRPVWMTFPRETLRDYVSHELRWSITLRHIRPWGYLATFLTLGFAWTLLVALIVPSWKVVAGYVATALTLRLWSAWMVGVRALGDSLSRRRLWLVPVREALSLGVYVCSFFKNTVRWRGTKYRVNGFQLIPIDGSEAPDSMLASTR